MKHCVKAKEAHSELKKALDGMLKVLKNLNDSLHVVGIKGFPVSRQLQYCPILMKLTRCSCLFIATYAIYRI